MIRQVMRMEFAYLCGVASCLFSPLVAILVVAQAAAVFVVSHLLADTDDARKEHFFHLSALNKDN